MPLSRGPVRPPTETEKAILRAWDEKFCVSLIMRELVNACDLSPAQQEAAAATLESYKRNAFAEL